MKYLIRFSMICVLLALAGAMNSCSNGSDDEPDGGKGDVVVITPTWDTPAYSVTDARTYTKAQLITRTMSAYSALMDEGTLTAFKELLGFSIYDFHTYHEDVIKYTSVDHKGQPIELSGIVSYKTLADAPVAIQQIVIDSHATITDNASCPSEGGSVAQLILLRTPSAIISADYQGYGASRSSLHPYLNEALTARQQADLVKAALDHLSHKSNQAPISNRVSAYSVGYSQGGAVALSLHHLLESEEPDLASAIGFKGSVCGDGPYDLASTFNAYIRQGYVTIPVILPMIVRAMMECYPDDFAGLTLADFFQPAFLNAGGDLMRLVDSKEVNVMAFNALLGAQNPLAAKFPLNEIFNPEALSPTSPQMAAMARAFERNNCIAGWTPSHRVCFFHSPDDSVVPYDNLNATSGWPSSVYSIIRPEKSGVDHLEGAMLFYMELMLKGPSQMK